MISAEEVRKYNNECQQAQIEASQALAKKEYLEKELGGHLSELSKLTHREVTRENFEQVYQAVNQRIENLVLQGREMLRRAESDEAFTQPQVEEQEPAQQTTQNTTQQAPKAPVQQNTVQPATGFGQTPKQTAGFGQTTAPNFGHNKPATQHGQQNPTQGNGFGQATAPNFGQTAWGTPKQAPNFGSQTPNFGQAMMENKQEESNKNEQKRGGVGLPITQGGFGQPVNGFGQFGQPMGANGQAPKAPQMAPIPSGQGVTIHTPSPTGTPVGTPAPAGVHTGAPVGFNPTRVTPFGSFGPVNPTTVRGDEDDEPVVFGSNGVSQI